MFIYIALIMLIRLKLIIINDPLDPCWLLSSHEKARLILTNFELEMTVLQRVRYP